MGVVSCPSTPIASLWDVPPHIPFHNRSRPEYVNGPFPSHGPKMTRTPTARNRLAPMAAVLCAAILPPWLAHEMTAGGKDASKEQGMATVAPAVTEAPLPGTGSTPLEIVEEGDLVRVVLHALGKSRVPRHPLRICALDYVDELTAIGTPLVAATCNSDGHFLDYLEDDLDGVVPICQMMGIMQPDFETLIEVAPDLIISSNPDPQTYRQLSKIAPVVVLTDGAKNARQRLLDLGELVGRRRQAEARQAWYDAKVEAAREALHEKVGDARVVFFRVFGKQYYIHGHTRGGLVLYDELELTAPSLIDSSPRGFLLSPEALLDLDAQYVFVAAERTNGSCRTWRELLDHPAWQRVPAVSESHVYWLEDRHHWLVLGLRAKARMIDEVLNNLAPESLEAVNRRADAALAREGA